MDDKGLKVMKFVFTLFSAVGMVGSALTNMEQHRIDVKHQDQMIEQTVADRVKEALDDSDEYSD